MIYIKYVYIYIFIDLVQLAPALEVKKTEMLASASRKPSLTAHVQQLLRRLAMLPMPLQKVLTILYFINHVLDSC